MVTAEQLLAKLEVREVGLRRRFELILDEMTQMRDSLLRVKASLSPGAASGSEPEDLRERRRSRWQAAHARAESARASRRTAALARAAGRAAEPEVGRKKCCGVAAGFLDIREELINNRVDTEDRKNRLKDQIADPLNAPVPRSFRSSTSGWRRLRRCSARRA